MKRRLLFIAALLVCNSFLHAQQRPRTLKGPEVARISSSLRTDLNRGNEILRSDAATALTWAQRVDNNIKLLAGNAPRLAEAFRREFLDIITKNPDLFATFLGITPTRGVPVPVPVPAPTPIPAPIPAPVPVPALPTLFDTAELSRRLSDLVIKGSQRPVDKQLVTQTEQIINVYITDLQQKIAAAVQADIITQDMITSVLQALVNTIGLLSTGEGSRTDILVLNTALYMLATATARIVDILINAGLNIPTVDQVLMQIATYVHDGLMRIYPQSAEVRIFKTDEEKIKNLLKNITQLEDKQVQLLSRLDNIRKLENSQKKLNENIHNFLKQMADETQRIKELIESDTLAMSDQQFKHWVQIAELIAKSTASNDIQQDILNLIQRRRDERALVVDAIGQMIIIRQQANKTRRIAELHDIINRLQALKKDIEESWPKEEIKPKTILSLLNRIDIVIKEVQKIADKAKTEELDRKAMDELYEGIESLFKEPAIAPLAPKDPLEIPEKEEIKKLKDLAQSNLRKIYNRLFESFKGLTQANAVDNITSGIQEAETFFSDTKFVAALGSLKNLSPKDAESYYKEVQSLKDLIKYIQILKVLLNERTKKIDEYENDIEKLKTITDITDLKIQYNLMKNRLSTYVKPLDSLINTWDFPKAFKDALRKSDFYIRIPELATLLKPLDIETVNLLIALSNQYSDDPKTSYPDIKLQAFTEETYKELEKKSGNTFINQAFEIQRKAIEKHAANILVPDDATKEEKQKIKSDFEKYLNLIVFPNLDKAIKAVGLDPNIQELRDQKTQLIEKLKVTYPQLF